MDSTSTIICGYISVASVMDTGSRKIERIYLDAERRKKVYSSAYHFPEKKQYSLLYDYSKAHGIKIDYMSAFEFKKLTESVSSGTSGGIAALVGVRKTDTVTEILAKNSGKGFYLAIDGIEDPFNFGYVLRVAYACGCDGVFLPERNYFTSSDIVIKSSAGASERIALAYYSDISCFINELNAAGVSVVTTAADNSSVSLEQAKLTTPLCVILGGEKRGINKALMSCAGTPIHIDYKRSFEMSLSASAAASIIIYEVSKRVFNQK